MLVTVLINTKSENMISFVLVRHTAKTTSATCDELGARRSSEKKGIKSLPKYERDKGVGARSSSSKAKHSNKMGHAVSSNPGHNKRMGGTSNEDTDRCLANNHQVRNKT